MNKRDDVGRQERKKIHKRQIWLPDICYVKWKQYYKDNLCETMFTLNRRQNRFSLRSEKGNHSKQPKGLFASQKSYELSYNALTQSDEREAHVGGGGVKVKRVFRWRDDDFVYSCTQLTTCFFSMLVNTVASKETSFLTLHSISERRCVFALLS